MSGISEVARIAGVSKATASRALTGRGYVAEETRLRVERAASDIGYVPSTNAVNLATGRTGNVAVVMPYVNRWFFAEVLEGVQSALLDAGLDLTLYDALPGSSGRAQVFDRFLVRRGFDGLIAIGIEPGDGEIERLLDSDRPVVLVVGDDPRASVVAIDDGRAARVATEHLLALGHEHIVFLGGGAEQGSFVDRTRIQGYAEAMTDAGLRPVLVDSPVSMPGGYAAAVDLLGDAHLRPTAIVAVCDEVAVGAIIAARRLGILVPSALSVVGIDDHEFAEMFALTTLQQRPRQQGATAAELLLNRLADRSLPPVTIRPKSRLIVRSSTAPRDDATSAITRGTA